MLHQRMAASMLLILVTCCLLRASVAAPTPAPADPYAKWRSATIYQTLTDRFAGSNTPCIDLKQYCGGTFDGMVDKLDYVTNMGFDAIWISPVIENTPNGYHGYWAKNLEKINPFFGSKETFKRLVDTYKSKGFRVMVDVVANHMGYANFADLYPFNQTSDYNDCANCDAQCNIPGWAWDQRNDPVKQHCRLVGLPDLNQDNPRVKAYLLQWVKKLVAEYGLDGIRIDTVPLVSKDFWKEYVNAASVFAIGEVFDGDPKYVGPFQQAVPGILSFPMYYTIKDVFGSQRWMGFLSRRRDEYKANFQDLGLLGTFADNHDVPRFLSHQPDYRLFYNALAWVLFSEGIPIIYYGSEAGFTGKDDPANREALWAGGYNTGHPLHQYLKTMIRYRKTYKVWKYSHDEYWYDDNCYAFARGQLLIVLTNVGSNKPIHTCSFPMPSTWVSWIKNGRMIPLSLMDGTAGRFQITDSGQATVTLLNGNPALFYAAPKPSPKPTPKPATRS